MGSNYPKNFFSKEPSKVESQTCFVIMPFADEFRPVYESIVDAVRGPGLNFSSCLRADELPGGGYIMPNVLAAIARNEVIVADVTAPNPNVYYELGIAHSVKPVRQVIIITQSVKDLPFDISHLNCIVYEPSSSGLEILKQRLVDSIREVTPAGLRFAVADNDTFKFRTRLEGPDRHLYDFDIEHVSIGMNLARLHIAVRRYAVDNQFDVVSTGEYGIMRGEGLDIPFLHWMLNLDDISENKAHFCLYEPVSDDVGP